MSAPDAARRRPRVVIGSDSLVLLAGLAAALRTEGFRVARGVTRLDRLGERLAAERVDGIIVGAANATSDGLLPVLETRPGGLAAVVLMPDLSLRIHADALRAAGAVCLPLSSHPKEIAAALTRARALAEGVVAVREEVVRGIGGRLSARETEALDRVARGDTNEEVAAALGVSPETIKTHLRNAFRKLGVRNRTEAVAAYLTAGSS